jgi:hypothetical protein
MILALAIADAIQEIKIDGAMSAISITLKQQMFKQTSIAVTFWSGSGSVEPTSEGFVSGIF